MCIAMSSCNNSDNNACTDTTGYDVDLDTISIEETTIFSEDYVNVEVGLDPEKILVLAKSILEYAIENKCDSVLEPYSKTKLFAISVDSNEFEDINIVIYLKSKSIFGTKYSFTIEYFDGINRQIVQYTTGFNNEISLIIT
jgi:hypothetical protein